MKILSEKSDNEYQQEQFEKKQNEMIDSVKKNANQLILERFPDFDQRNIANGLKTEIRDRQTDAMITQSEMNSLINDMINATEQYEEEIDNCSTIDELEKITINLKSKAGW